jgi:LmbE family N-acetylglucosaminyl deacetylase
MELHSVQVVTFDELGVSGHPNHISTHYGVLQWHRQSNASSEVLFLVRLGLWHAAASARVPVLSVK